MEKNPQDMSLSELAEHCRNQMNNYRCSEAYDDQYCLEIFRRAMLEKDALAWDLLHGHFKPLMLSWLRRHPKREVASHFDSEENYVAHAFERFWHATVRNQELEFTTLAAALRYLQASLNGAILDTLRTYLRVQERPLPEPGCSDEPAVEDSDDGYDLWQIIQSLFLDKREQHLAYLLFHCGLKPREIVQYFPQEFSNVQEIYRLHRNSIERLQRKREQLRWLLGDE